MRTYTDSVLLPNTLTLGDMFSLREKVREYGFAEFNIESNKLRITFEEDDDWDLRSVLADLETEFHSYGVDFEVDKTKIVSD